MNNARRKELDKAMRMRQEAKDIIEAVKDEEESAFENLPEGLQYSDKGYALEENAADLGLVVDELDNQLSEIDDVICR